MVGISWINERYLYSCSILLFFDKFHWVNPGQTNGVVANSYPTKETKDQHACRENPDGKFGLVFEVSQPPIYQEDRCWDRKGGGKQS